MNLPSVVNTWIRLFPRSSTYTRPSLEMLTSCGTANCWRAGHIEHSAGQNGFGPLGGTDGRAEISSGLFPYAPHMRLKFPVSASYTITRLFPYPSATNNSLVLG